MSTYSSKRQTVLERFWSIDSENALDAEDRDGLRQMREASQAPIFPTVVTRDHYKKFEHPEAILDWRLDEESCEIEYQAQLRGGKVVWIFQRYMQNAGELLDSLAAIDADFAIHRSDLPNHSQPLDSLVSKALGEMCLEMHDDDPQLELRQPDDQDEINWLEDPLDPIEDSPASRDAHALEAAVMPLPASRMIGKTSASGGDFVISPKWGDLLDKLCRKTGTECARELLNTAIEDAIRTLDHADLHSNLCDVSHVMDFDPETFTFLIAVWLLICFWVSKNALPEDVFVTNSCGALRTTAWTIFKACGTQDAFRGKVQANELMLRRHRWLAHLRNNQLFSKRAVMELKDSTEPKLPSMGFLRPEAQQLLDDCLFSKGQFQHPLHVRLACRTLENDISSGGSPLSKVCVDPLSKEWLQREAAQLFASVDSSVLESCIRGRVAQDSQIFGHRTCSELKKNRREKDKPAVYHNALCDRAGMPPTPRQTQHAIEFVSRYIVNDPSFNKTARDIDFAVSPTKSWPEKFSLRGFRRYCDYRELVINKNATAKSVKRRNLVAYFLKNLSTRVAADTEQGRSHIPFAQAIVEIGYTKNMDRRLREHQQHMNSNYIMNVMHATLEHLYPGVFILQQQILHVCWKPTHSWLGEILFTDLCDGYTSGGAGFSHYPAGFSNGSAYKSSTLDKWHEWEDWADRRFRPHDRLGKELDFLQTFISRTENQAAVLRHKLQNVTHSNQGSMGVNINLDGEINTLEALNEILDVYLALCDPIV